MAEKTLVFIKEKETKNTVRLQEEAIPGEPPVIGTLYMQKWFVGEAEKVTMTVKAGE